MLCRVWTTTTATFVVWLQPNYSFFRVLAHCALSRSYSGEGHQGHPVIDYKVSVSRNKKPTSATSSGNERVMAAGLSKMLRRFSMDTTGSHHKVNKSNQDMD